MGRKYSPSQGFEPHTVQAVASRYTDHALGFQSLCKYDSSYTSSSGCHECLYEQQDETAVVTVLSFKGMVFYDAV